MKKRHWHWMAPLYAIVLMSLLLTTIGIDQVVTVISESIPPQRRKVVIDPGHGGIDGGATSCTGVMESKINLEIALRLRDLLPLLGTDAVLTREDDRSLHTQGSTIAAQKLSDLKQRVTIANTDPDCILVSIHQNYFSDSKYSGAQVFYASTNGSQQLAEQLQKQFIVTLNPGSHRQAKRAAGIYLMEHIKCTAVLVECGFLSNYSDATALTDPFYQKKVCCVIAAALCNYSSA